MTDIFERVAAMRQKVASPIRHEGGRATPKRFEVGIYWPDFDRTAIYVDCDFYENDHIQNLASDQGAEIIF